MNRSSSLLMMVLYFLSNLSAQEDNTVGVLKYNSPTEGYNLVYPHNQPNTYLLNNCGEVVHVWEDDDEFSPGNISYLLEDGRLVRAKKPAEFLQETFGAGGAGGIIEWRSWENELINSFTFMDTVYRAHHDVASLPNGNVLAIIWERRTLDEVIEYGGDVAYHPVEERWPDMIVELDPILDTIVWEWHAWDHLIQDFDSTKANYGVVRDHPERININTDLGEFGLRPDWMHINAIDYNRDRDQILLSAPYFNEIWVIDHSTTTAEAASNKGGQSGKGGDLLYRWGNPANYDSGDISDQKAFFQHDARWELNSQGNTTGRISFFNNRVGADSSQVNIIAPIWNDSLYLMNESMWLPTNSDRIITHPDMPIFSSGLSGAEILSSGNVLVTVGREGFVFEITPENNVVWEYKVPLRNGNPVDQGTILEVNDNITFKMNRYRLDFSAFLNRDLTTNGTIETNPNLSLCVTTSNNKLEKETGLSVYPNPTNQYVNIEGQLNSNMDYSIFGISGKLILNGSTQEENKIDISFLEDGIYWLKLGGEIRKVIKQSF